MKCTHCGYAEKFNATTTSHHVRIGDREVSAEIPAEACPSCGDVYTSGAELERCELAIADAVIESGEVSGATFRFLRHQAGYTAKALGELIDRSPETISRWENGSKPVERVSWLTLALVVRGRESARALAETVARHPTKFPETIKVA